MFGLWTVDCGRLGSPPRVESTAKRHYLTKKLFCLLLPNKIILRRSSSIVSTIPRPVREVRSQAGTWHQANQPPTRMQREKESESRDLCSRV